MSSVESTVESIQQTTNCDSEDEDVADADEEGGPAAATQGLSSKQNRAAGRENLNSDDDDDDVADAEDTAAEWPTRGLSSKLARAAGHEKLPVSVLGSLSIGGRNARFSLLYGDSSAEDSLGAEIEDMGDDEAERGPRTLRVRINSTAEVIVYTPRTAMSTLSSNRSVDTDGTRSMDSSDCADDDAPPVAQVAVARAAAAPAGDDSGSVTIHQAYRSRRQPQRSPQGLALEYNAKGGDGAPAAGSSINSFNGGGNPLLNPQRAPTADIESWPDGKDRIGGGMGAPTAATAATITSSSFLDEHDALPGLRIGISSPPGGPQASGFPSGLRIGIGGQQAGNTRPPAGLSIRGDDGGGGGLRIGVPTPPSSSAALGGLRISASSSATPGGLRISAARGNVTVAHESNADIDMECLTLSPTAVNRQVEARAAARLRTRSTGTPCATPLEEPLGGAGLLHHRSRAVEPCESLSAHRHTAGGGALHGTDHDGSDAFATSSRLGEEPVHAHAHDRPRYSASSAMRCNEGVYGMAGAGFATGAVLEGAGAVARLRPESRDSSDETGGGDGQLIHKHRYHHRARGAELDTRPSPRHYRAVAAASPAVPATNSSSFAVVSAAVIDESAPITAKRRGRDSDSSDGSGGGRACAPESGDAVGCDAVGLARAGTDSGTTSSESSSLDSFDGDGGGRGGHRKKSSRRSRDAHDDMQ